ncbi:hypothetical protein [Deinococcus enclensis]|uniref:Uncharacterized protein n=1 Tax=Deinococcus enclensis TaxID=1049582 RepID=A0ABT9MF76_9DEIO|nr:hypothetical protein [Deinococcus enclensis]MDP9765252.1 hypothetical protein [Deinococcus enclensis]
MGRDDEAASALRPRPHPGAAQTGLITEAPSLRIPLALPFFAALFGAYVAASQTYASWPEPWRERAVSVALLDPLRTHGSGASITLTVHGQPHTFGLPDALTARCATSAQTTIVEYRHTLSDPDGPGIHPDDHGRTWLGRRTWSLTTQPPFPAQAQDWTPLHVQGRQTNLAPQLRRALASKPCTEGRLYVTPDRDQDHMLDVLLS